MPKRETRCTVSLQRSNNDHWSLRIIEDVPGGKRRMLVGVALTDAKVGQLLAAAEVNGPATVYKDES